MQTFAECLFLYLLIYYQTHMYLKFCLQFYVYSFLPVWELQRGVQRLGPGVIHLQLSEATEDL